METTKEISIKGMVCTRCIALLRQKLEDRGFQVLDIRLGKITLPADSQLTLKELCDITRSLGFDILQPKESRLVQHIKQAVERYLNDPDPSQKFSVLLSTDLKTNYDYLSAVFRQIEGLTIESYFIQRRLERVKCLLSSEAISLTEISYRLGYSSVHHLSRQFKEVVGINPSSYKEQAQHKMI